MTPRSTFRPGAWAELREARRWYEGQVAGLGRAFVAEVDAALAFVAAHPRMYLALDAGGAVRRVLLHRFPYQLVYEILDSGDIVILACLHVRRGEVDWESRR